MPLTTEVTLRLCYECEVRKPLDDFHVSNGSRYRTCKECQRAGWRARGRSAAYWDKRRETELMKFYGITLAHYNEMLERQNGGCAICGRPEPSGRRLAVDHCHSTGKVRGLLCAAHNRAIGLLQDDVATAEALVTYLRVSV